jgi:hypothetical protein
MKLIRGVLLVMILLGQFVVTALCQQVNTPTLNASPSSTATSNGPSLPAAPVINPVNSSPTTTALSPTGARQSVSISTVIVCDFTDFSGAFPSVDDVCSTAGH